MVLFFIVFDQQGQDFSKGLFFRGEIVAFIQFPALVSVGQDSQDF